MSRRYPARAGRAGRTQAAAVVRARDGRRRGLLGGLETLGHGREFLRAEVLAEMLEQLRMLIVDVVFQQFLDHREVRHSLVAIEVAHAGEFGDQRIDAPVFNGTFECEVLRLGIAKTGQRPVTTSSLCE
jgi:hypothetical protein